MSKVINKLKLQQTLQEMVAEYGIRESVSMLAQALQEYANDMSDMSLKEKAKSAAEMADLLRDVKYALSEDSSD